MELKFVAGVLAVIAAIVVAALLEEPPPVRVGPAGYVPDATRGRELFLHRAMCLSCHMLGEMGGFNAPPLDHVATKFTRLKGGREQARKFFHDHIVDPKNNPGTEREKYPMTQMPSFLNSMGEEGIADICEYLLTLE